MRFSLYSKKSGLKKKEHLPVDGTLTQRQRTITSTSKTYRQCKYAKYKPRLGHDRIDTNSTTEHDYNILWDKTAAITKKNRIEHMRIIALFILNRSLGTWKPSTLKKEILKIRGELNFIGDTHCDVNYQNVNGLPHCLAKQAKLFHKIMEKEFGYQQMSYFHNAWMKLKSQHTSIKTDKHKKDHDTEIVEVEHKTKTKSFDKSNFNESSKTVDPSSLIQDIVQDNSEVCDKKRSPPINGTRKKNTFKSAGAVVDSAISKPVMKGCSNSTDDEKLSHHRKEDDLVQRNTTKMSCKSKCPKNEIKIFPSGRFGSINEKHCNAVSELVNDRLFSKQGKEICCFIQDNLSDTWDLIHLKHHLTQMCLESFFFPLGNRVHTNIRRDLYDFFLINIFMPDDIIRDIFGVKHNIEDIHDIDLLLLVPCKYVAIFRHRRLCFLDTLSTILGSSKDKMLIIKV